MRAIRRIILLILWLTANSLSSQKHDYIWLSGYSTDFIGFYPPHGFYYGITELDFNHSPRSVTFNSSRIMSFSRTNVSFCDSDGQLLFYSNGIYVANSLNEKIENSDSLNAGYMLYRRYPAMQHLGYRNVQGIICIPSLTNFNQYYLIHSWTDSLQNSVATKRILVTDLDMSLNTGHGKVLSKNVPVITNDFLGFDLTATRHGNGKDWWLLVQKRNTNCYYRILVNDGGVNLLDSLICGAGDVPSGYIATCAFSPDGRKYAYFNSLTGLNLFDFDRCSGSFNNAVNIPFPVIRDSMWIGLGVAISPSNQFLYLCVTRHVYQLDLWAADVLGSIDTVAIFDGTNAPFPALFHTAQLGPDGKIYIGCGNGDTVYHVINQPDMKGAACDFRQHSLSLPSPSMGVPNFPNYRLGRKVGSECDTLWNSADEEKISSREKVLKIFPNPASDVVTVDYGFTDWSKGGEITIQIVSELGQLVWQQEAPRYSGFQKLAVSGFSSGVYTVNIKRNGFTIATSKFAKQ